jgi:List-Bact-rpt repeat protein
MEIKRLLKASKTLKIVVFTLLTVALVMAVLGSNISIVKAQAQDSVFIYLTSGGTIQGPDGTTLTGGTTYNYTDQTTQTFTAVPGSGFVFSSWDVITQAGAYTDAVNNPITITLNATADGGSSYALQANFNAIAFIGPYNATTAPLTTDAIVVVLAGVGGTVSPVPGTYALASAEALDLTAKADPGFTFSHWIIGGTPMNHGAYSFTDTPTNNPYNVNHGYGNTYTYQAVFSPVSSTTSPSPTIPEFSSMSAIILALALVIVATGTFVYTRRTKK